MAGRGRWWGTASRKSRLRFSVFMLAAAAVLVAHGLLQSDVVSVLIGLGGGVFMVVQLRRALKETKTE